MTKDKRKWTIEEDEALLQGLEAELARPTGRGNSINWNEIAKRVPLRNNKDCRKRYLNGMAWNLKKGPWSVEEDIQLKDLIQQYGTSWVDVSRAMGTRSADQCSKRWYHCLNPELDRQPWKKDEIRILMDAYKVHGSSWKLIQEKYLPSRSANNIRNQYTILTRYSSRSGRQSPSRRSDTGSPSASSSRRTTAEPQTIYDDTNRLALEASSFHIHKSNATSPGAIIAASPVSFGTDIFSGFAGPPTAPAPQQLNNNNPSVYPGVSNLSNDSFRWMDSSAMAGDEYCLVPHSGAAPRPPTYSTYFQPTGGNFAMMPTVTAGAPVVAQPHGQNVSWATYNPGLFPATTTAQRPGVSWAPSRGAPAAIAPFIEDGSVQQMGYMVDEHHMRR